MTDTSLPYICQHRQAHKVNTALNLSFCPADQFYSARVVVFGSIEMFWSTVKDLTLS